MPTFDGDLCRGTTNFWGSVNWSEPMEFVLQNSRLSQRPNKSSMKGEQIILDRQNIKNAGISLQPNEAEPAELVITNGSTTIRLKHPTDNKDQLRKWKMYLDQAKGSASQTSVSMSSSMSNTSKTRDSVSYGSMQEEQKAEPQEPEGVHGAWYTCLFWLNDKDHDGHARGKDEFQKLLQVYTNDSYKDAKVKDTVAPGRNGIKDATMVNSVVYQLPTLSREDLEERKRKNPHVKSSDPDFFTSESTVFPNDTATYVDDQGRTQNKHQIYVMYKPIDSPQCGHGLGVFFIHEAATMKTTRLHEIGVEMLENFQAAYPNREDWKVDRCKGFAEPLRALLLKVNGKSKAQDTASHFDQAIKNAEQNLKSEADRRQVIEHNFKQGETMVNESEAFKKNAHDLSNMLWWQNQRMCFCLVFIILLIVAAGSLFLYFYFKK